MVVRIVAGVLNARAPVMGKGAAWTPAARAARQAQAAKAVRPAAARIPAASPVIRVPVGAAATA